MPACEMNPADKKKFVGAVGQRLVQKHGKKKHYKPEDVRSATIDAGFPIDFVCWAYCMFCSPDDFKTIHEANGEDCDYVDMKTELLAELATNGSFLDIDIDLSWLEWPDIDLSGLFDWFDIF